MLFLFWVPIWVAWLLVGSLYLSLRVKKDIPILINGLIPSEQGATSKDESGTTVYICFADQEASEKSAEVFRGYANEGGKVIATIPKKNIGRTLAIRVRHAAFKFHDFQLVVPAHGIVHTMKMEKDGVYNGKVRGRNVGDLDRYYEEALFEAEQYRTDFIKRAARISARPIARIPVLFWVASYLLAVAAFAGDFWRYPSAFDECLTSYLHSFYFSAVTITTLGYGEVTPIHDTMRLAVSFEAIAGIFLVGFALNSLFSGASKS